MKHKWKLRNYYGLEDINKTRQMDLVYDPVLDPELGKVARKDNIHKNDQFEYVLWITALHQF